MSCRRAEVGLLTSAAPGEALVLLRTQSWGSLSWQSKGREMPSQNLLPGRAALSQAWVTPGNHCGCFDRAFPVCICKI